KIEVALTQLRGVSNDRANAESSPAKTVERGRCAFVVVDLLDPAFDEADAEAALEAFDRQHFQVRQNPVLKMSGGIFCVEFHLPGPRHFNVPLRNTFSLIARPCCLR